MLRVCGKTFPRHPHLATAISLERSSASEQLKLTRELPGDFNLNGLFGAEDYVAWRKLYATWYAGFASNTGGQGAAVPEPEAVVMVIVGVVAASRRRARN